MKLQIDICAYLENNMSTQVLTDKMAEDILRQTRKDFLIGHETYPAHDSSARYFQIYFKEIRSDQQFVQITPMACFRSGYLKIDSNGEMLLTDCNFNPFNSSLSFSFEQGELISNINWNIASKERSSSLCIKKGILTLGLFAVTAGTVYAATTASSNLNFDL